VIYPIGGTATDMAYAGYGIALTFCVELRDDLNDGKYGFLLPESEINGCGLETLAALKVVATSVANGEGSNLPKPAQTPEPTSPTQAPTAAQTVAYAVITSSITLTLGKGLTRGDLIASTALQTVITEAYCKAVKVLDCSIVRIVRIGDVAVKILLKEEEAGTQKKQRSLKEAMEEKVTVDFEIRASDAAGASALEASIKTLTPSSLQTAISASSTNKTQTQQVVVTAVAENLIVVENPRVDTGTDPSSSSPTSGTSGPVLIAAIVGVLAGLVLFIKAAFALSERFLCRDLSGKRTVDQESAVVGSGRIEQSLDIQNPGYAHA